MASSIMCHLNRDLKERISNGNIWGRILRASRSKHSKDPEVGVCGPCLRPEWPEQNGLRMAGDEVRDVGWGTPLGHGEVALTLSEMKKHWRFYAQKWDVLIYKCWGYSNEGDKQKNPKIMCVREVLEGFLCDSFKASWFVEKHNVQKVRKLAFFSLLGVALSLQLTVS